MTDHLNELHAEIITILKADGTLSPLVNDVYGALPSDANFPCISIENIAAQDVSTRTTSGFHVGISVKIFSRARDNSEAINILSEVRRILDGASITLPGSSVTSITENASSIHRLSDGITWVAKTTFITILQEGASTFIADGNQFLLKVGDGATPTENFTILGGLRNIGVGVSSQIIDASNLTSGQWRKLFAPASIQSISISGNGFFSDSASEELLRGYVFAGTINNYEILFGNNNKLSGGFLVSSYKRSGNMNSEEDFTVTLESSGVVTFT